MQLFSALAVAALSATLSSAAVVTQIDYVTQYNYENVDVLVDNNGVPYSTVTSTVSTGGAPGAAGATVTRVAAAAVTPSASTSAAAPPAAAPAAGSTSAAPPAAAPSPASSAPDAPAAPAVSHSHPAVENYNYITPSESSSPAAATTSSAPAPGPSTPSLTTSSWVPPSTTAAAPSTTSAAGGGSFNGDATFYDVGLGACGVQNSDSELIAALNVDQFNQFGSMSNGNPVCGKKATLHYQGKSVTVTIQDKCMGCKYGDLDLSPAAFAQLADKSVGRFEMSWSFV